jgi:hypothetical protein
MRILLSEGSSTSARKAITALGREGHAVAICDPDPHCLGGFYGFVRRFHRRLGLAGLDLVELLVQVSWAAHLRAGPALGPILGMQALRGCGWQAA